MAFKDPGTLQHYVSWYDNLMVGNTRKYVFFRALPKFPLPPSFPLNLSFWKNTSQMKVFLWWNIYTREVTVMMIQMVKVLMTIMMPKSSVGASGSGKWVRRRRRSCQASTSFHRHCHRPLPSLPLLDNDKMWRRRKECCSWKKDRNGDRVVRKLCLHVKIFYFP